MGDFLITSLERNDVSAVAGRLLIAAATIVVINLIADLLCGILDPRTRYA